MNSLRVAKTPSAIVTTTLFVTILVFSIVPAGPAGAGGDWPEFLGPNRDGISTEKGWSFDWPKEGPKKLWKASLGTGYSSMSIKDSRVYAMGYVDETDRLYCLDANTGKEIWKYSYPCKTFTNNHQGGPACTPTVAGGSVYILSRTGEVHCVEAATGNRVWSKNLQKEFASTIPKWGFCCSPLVEEDLLILDVGPVVALNKPSGDIAWSSEDYGAGYSSPVALDLHGKRVVALINAFGLVILNTRTGAEVSKFRWETNSNINVAVPVIEGDKFFISSAYDTGCTLVRVDGDGKPHSLWENVNLKNHFTSSILWKGHLYGFDGNVGNAPFKCVELETGEVKWESAETKDGSLLMADGKLIILTGQGELVIAETSPEEFKEISRNQVLGGQCWTVPAATGGRIYCRNSDGELVCLDASAGG